jgi:hypothetical protein
MYTTADESLVYCGEMAEEFKIVKLARRYVWLGLHG